MDNGPMLIRDIPKIRDLLKQANAFRSFKTVFPILKPFFRFLGLDVSCIEQALETARDLAQQVDELATIPDRFNDLFASRGWIIYELMNLDVARNAMNKAEAGDFDAAEDVLADFFSPETVSWQLKTMFAVEAFRPRMALAQKALIDYDEARYHACTPVILAQIDGLVSELHEKQRGFFADAVELEAWDSLAAHSKGLTHLSEIFRKGRRKTTTESITIPFRHGIMHGRDLGYDNRIVAAKTWAALFAVREWAIKAERSMLMAPPEEPERSWREILRGIAYHAEEKSRWEQWVPRSLAVDEIPPDPKPNLFDERTPERGLTEYLHWWKASNYGYMANYLPFLFRKYAEKPLPAQVRDQYHGRRLVSFRLTSFKHSVPALAEIAVDLKIESAGEQRDLSITYRLVCEDQSGNMVSQGSPDANWLLMNWDSV